MTWSCCESGFWHYRIDIRSRLAWRLGWICRFGEGRSGLERAISKRTWGIGYWNHFLSHLCSLTAHVWTHVMPFFKLIIRPSLAPFTRVHPVHKNIERHTECVNVPMWWNPPVTGRFPSHMARVAEFWYAVGLNKLLHSRNSSDSIASV